MPSHFQLPERRVSQASSFHISHRSFISLSRKLTYAVTHQAHRRISSPTSDSKHYIARLSSSLILYVVQCGTYMQVIYYASSSRSNISIGVPYVELPAHISWYTPLHHPKSAYRVEPHVAEPKEIGQLRPQVLGILPVFQEDTSDIAHAI